MDPLQKLATTLPRWAFVGGVLVIGIFLLLIINPPHSVCDSQMEVLKTSQTPFLYLDGKKKYIKTTGFDAAFKNCRNGNSLGACVDLFSNVQKLAQDVEGSNPECVVDLADTREIKKAFRDTQELMVELAWGNQPPESTYDKFRWLDNNHMFLFCKLTDIRMRGEGKEGWESWREKTMMALPNPANLPRAELWRRSIFSASCSNY
jgi:hypothetical protein